MEEKTSPESDTRPGKERHSAEEIERDIFIETTAAVFEFLKRGLDPGRDIPSGSHPDWPSLGTLMSNFDHTIEPDAEARLKEGRCTGQYSAWNFFGIVWWEEEAAHFVCEVWINHQIAATAQAATLVALRDGLCALFGYD